MFCPILTCASPTCDAVVVGGFYGDGYDGRLLQVHGLPEIDARPGARTRHRELGLALRRPLKLRQVLVGFLHLQQ